MAIALASLRSTTALTPPRILLHGVAGIGKTTFAAAAPATGKSVCIAAFMRRAIADWPDTRILIVTHVKELIAQNHAEMIRLIGFTGTPCRLDSGLLHEGDGALFTDIAFEAGVAEMIAQGYLCEVVPKRTATQLDTTQVGSLGGEFIQGQLEAAVDVAEVTQAAVDEIVRHGADRGSWLVFCAGVRHAEHVRDAIQNRGFPCEAILGETASAERDRVIAAFKRGEIRCLTDANVLTTGFNALGVDLIAMLRPTKSVGL